LKKTYNAYVQAFEDGYLARVPDLPSCASSGKTMQEASEKATDALTACLLFLEKEGLPIPEPTPLANLDTPLDAHMLVLPIDIVGPRQFIAQPVPGKVSMPAWFNGLVKKRKVDFS